MIAEGGPITVLLIITGLNVGGAETQFVRLATNLDRSVWRPHVLCMLPPGKMASGLAASQVEVSSLNMAPGRPGLLAFIKTVKLIRALKPKVIVSFMYHANLLGRLAGRLACVPVIVASVRTPNIGGRLRELILLATDRLGTVTVINSSYSAEILVRKRVVSRKRMTVIPNALMANPGDMGNYPKSAMRSELGITGKFTWIAVGRLHEAKDYPSLLKAFSSVVASEPDTRLVVVGSGRLSDQLNDLALELGIQEYVTFLGQRDDVGMLLSMADAYVMSSSWEGMPNALMEAMALGKPSVATAVGGVNELIQPEVSGVVVPPKDTQALASAMLRVTRSSDEMRLEMGRAAKSQVTQKYSLGSVIGCWDSLLRSLMGDVSARN